jgi:hypothetical protein
MECETRTAHDLRHLHPRDSMLGEYILIVLSKYLEELPII